MEFLFVLYAFCLHFRFCAFDSVFSRSSFGFFLRIFPVIFLWLLQSIRLHLCDLNAKDFCITFLFSFFSSSVVAINRFTISSVHKWNRDVNACTKHGFVWQCNNKNHNFSWIVQCTRSKAVVYAVCILRYSRFELCDCAQISCVNLLAHSCTHKSKVW